MPIEGGEVRLYLLSQLHLGPKLLYQHVKWAAEIFIECLLHASHAPQARNPTVLTHNHMASAVLTSCLVNLILRQESQGCTRGVR